MRICTQQLINLWIKLIAQIKKHKDKLKTHLTKRERVIQKYSDEFETEAIEKEILASSIVKNKEINLSR